MAASIPFTFTVDMPGQESFARGLSRFADEITNFEPFWEQWFKPAWFRHITLHYETQGASTGAQWPPLSEAYGVWKQKHWPGLPVGVLSAATRESLTFPGDPRAIWDAGPRSLTVGTNVPYAMFLQQGTGGRGATSVARKSKSYVHGAGAGMPARPPLRVNDEFVNLMGSLLQEFSVKTIRKQLPEST